MNLVLLLLVFLSPLAEGCYQAPAAPTRRLVAFVSTANGVFNSGRGGTCFDISQPDYADEVILRMEPLDVPVLYPAWGIHYAVQKNDTTVAEQILAVTERHDGSIQMTVYRLNKKTEQEQGTFDKSHLENLALDDMTRRDDCEINLYQKGRNVFKGTWPQCLLEPVEDPRVYDSTVTCDVFELRNPELNILSRTIQSCGRYPLLPYMKAGPRRFRRTRCPRRRSHRW